MRENTTPQHSILRPARCFVPAPLARSHGVLLSDALGRGA
ncbi:hypothetical protein DVJ83_10000 [Deinococcus wulumuqiensis]|uniref:Uncharacterized protein n=1 Tax=Deinococcus wulumuqiensis TaxID=980427 RepID=A0A345IKB1_9DEIO|nr:hypothetical protein DVJ83_10000 [Deinococcus wulumuqiensis]